jgi:pimeloyl-ACP methyl ester carboxylesterase
MELKNIDLWHIWDNISCQTLVLRGVHSKVMDHKDATTMAERSPKAKLIELPDMCHAPAIYFR